MTKNRIKGTPPLSSPRMSTHEAPRRNSDKCPPVFSFQHLVESHDIEKCSSEEKVRILHAIYKRSRINWEELKKIGRHKLGCEPIEQESLRVPLPRVVTPDTTILSFRCIEMAPMIGFRDEDRFHVLWIDRKFDCYPHS